MPSTRSLRFAVLFALAAAVALAACDSPGTASPSSAPAASAEAEPCLGDDLESSGIQGRVVDTEGNPLTDILVILETPSFVGEARTGDDGVFQTSGVTGEFAISTVNIDYRGSPRQITVECGETVDVELVLTPVGG